MNIISFWQNLPRHIDPIAFSLGPVSVHWYGLMYVVAFIVVYFLIIYRLKTEKDLAQRYNSELISDFMVVAMVAVLLGGRIGYVLIYDLGYFLRHPVKIFSPFEMTQQGIVYTGIYGMSYHGGVVGLIIAALYFCKKKGLDFWQLSDLFASAVPLGYTFGRLGNFINGELYGRIASVPWAMYFPMDSKAVLRHPSQLYEAFFEGIFLFVIVWALRKKGNFDGFLLCVYIAGYGAVRFVIEFYREPDPQLGLVAMGLTMGQFLCICMLVFAAVLFVLRSRHIPK